MTGIGRKRAVVAGLLATVLLLGLLGTWLLAPRSVLSTLPDLSRLVSAPAPEAPSLASLMAELEGASEPERKLFLAMQKIVDGDIQSANDIALELTTKYPNFQLAHIIKADINNARLGKGSLIFATNEQGEPAAPHLAHLRTELLRRVEAVRERPDGNSWPAQLIAFNPNSPYAMVVDASKSRLYLLRRSDTPGAAPELIHDFFMSVGKAGIGKEVEGDNKTPLGVYRVLQRRDSTELPVFYGSGALTLDYPNSVDRHLRKTGHGIWIHGSPPENMVRPPEASEGCVVLSNTDMSALLNLAGVIGAPVIISESISWVDAQTHALRQNELLGLLNSWLQSQALTGLTAETAGLQFWNEPSGKAYMAAAVVHENGTDVRRFFFELTGSGLDLIASIPRLPSRTPTMVAGVSPPQAALTQPQRQEAPSAEVTAILSAMDGWAKAWSRKAVNEYFAFYHPAFVASNGQRGESWRSERRARILPRDQISVSFSTPRIVVTGNMATSTFVQSYTADGNTMRARKRLTFQQLDGRWLITREEVI